MLDDDLAALWNKEVDRERNPVFELVVMRRMEGALFRRAIALNLAAVAAATLLLAFCAPLLTDLWQQIFAHFFSPPIVALLLTAFSILLSKLFLRPGRVNGRLKSG